ncbi:uncharacterized protein VNE69_09048 [Vairimorpha necatrix]|uniref:GIY-YIG homing endonuclease n=1 Tax=Vairimorpha necatrix TaxID=6039 RepID=A0AAX4JF81_9MICR
MFVKIFSHFLMEYCQLTLFSIYNEEKIYCYIGVSADVAKINNYNIFLTRNINYLYKTIISKHKLEEMLKYTLNNGIFLRPVHKNHHDNLRKLADTLKHDNLYQNFINSVYYYECKFSLQKYEFFLFEMIYHETEKSTISWSRTGVIRFDSKKFFEKLSFEDTKSLDIHVTFGQFLNNLILRSNQYTKEIETKGMIFVESPDQTFIGNDEISSRIIQKRNQKYKSYNKKRSTKKHKILETNGNGIKDNHYSKKANSKSIIENSNVLTTFLHDNSEINNSNARLDCYIFIFLVIFCSILILFYFNYIFNAF